MRFENSMCNVAYDILKEVNEKVSFNALWETVCHKLGIEGEDKVNLISNFYTQLTLDGRFMVLEGNYWDLRANHTFDEFAEDSYDFYTDDDDSDPELVDEEEVGYEEEDEEEDDDYNESEEEDDSY